MIKYKGRIDGENRKVTFSFTEKRKAFIDIYNYLDGLFKMDEFLELLYIEDDSSDNLEKYADLLESIHLKLDGLIFELTRNNKLDVGDILNKRNGYDWYSYKGLRDKIMRQLRVISNITYFKMYNSELNCIDRLTVEVIESV